LEDKYLTIRIGGGTQKGKPSHVHKGVRERGEVPHGGKMEKFALRLKMLERDGLSATGESKYRGEVTRKG